MTDEFSGVSDELRIDADRFLTDPRAQHAPYELFRRLRAESPVHRTSHGAWLVARYTDCEFVLRDKRWSNADAACVVAARTFDTPAATRLFLSRMGTTDNP